MSAYWTHPRTLFRLGLLIALNTLALIAVAVGQYLTAAIAVIGTLATVVNLVYQRRLFTQAREATFEDLDMADRIDWERKHHPRRRRPRDG